MSLKNIRRGRSASEAPLPDVRLTAKVLMVALAGLLIAGCSGDNLSDLRSFVQAEKAKPGGHVEPIPEVKPFESFTYKVNGRKSPFQPWGLSAGAAKLHGASAGGLHPNTSRRREALEAFPLDTLRMVGTVSQKNGIWAIIQAPDHLVYRVTRNNYLGQNYGRITKITENKVELVEIVPDGIGGWLKRRASLVLADKSQ
ncbi:MAG: pilus assembly protein PilP [Gammaproteobacteria bacterium]|jgi:type IV pilus assembly protein PilP